MTTATLTQSKLVRSIPLGLRYMAGAAFFFSIMSLLVKLAGQGLPTMQIVLARYVVMLGLTHVMLTRSGVSPAGIDRGALVGRAVTGFAALSLFYYAVVELPLGDVTTLHFMSPVFAALIAAVFLKERAGGIVWIGAVISLSGVVLIAQPSFLFGGQGLPQLAVTAALCGAILSATAYNFVRKLRKTDHHLVVIYWFCAIGVVLTLPFAIPVAVWPTPTEWGILLGVGVATQIAQVFLTKGLHLEPMGRATSVSYLQIIFAFIWGIAFFGDLPNVWNALGAAVIIGSVVVVARHRAGRAPAPLRGKPKPDENTVVATRIKTPTSRRGAANTAG